MKKRIVALAAALALCISMAGCTISTPSTVGKIGEIEITSGMCLLSQFQAYSKAQSFASSAQDTSNVKKFLKQNILTDADAASGSAADSTASSAASGAASDADEGTKVSEYVAAETLKNIQYYAAVKTRFAELGGKLTEEEIAQADSTAQSIWDANSALYAKNGFGLETIKDYEYTLAMSGDLLELTYGASGEQPVSDTELTDYLENDLVYGYYISVPLYNSTTYAFADEDQKAKIEKACEAVVEEYNRLHSAGTNAPADTAASENTAESASTADSAASADTAKESAIHDDFYQAVLAKLPDAYAVLDNTYDASTTSITANFIDEASMSYYGDDADKIRSSKVGEAVVAALGTYSYEIFVREDPLAVNTLDDVRGTALQDMKGQELSDALYAYGADTLENALDESAVKQLPAANIKLASSGNAAA